MPMTMDEHERLARIDERTSAIKKLLDELAVDLRASRETQARHDEQIKTLQRGGGAGMTNPMTTAGDIITGGTSGTPQRLGVATDGEVLTLVSGAPAWAAAGAGATPAILLDYALASDRANNTAYSAATWVDIVANQTFTPASSASLIEIVVTGYLMVGAMSAAGSVGVRLIVDSAGTPVTKMLGGGRVNPSGGIFVNPLAGAGSVYLSGLSAAAHTVKPQFNADQSGAWYLLPSTNPNQHSLRIQVIEHK